MGKKAISTFLEDQYKDEKFDYIMANLPFNQKARRGEKELLGDGAGTVTKCRSQAMQTTARFFTFYHLSQNDTAGFLLANGALSVDGTDLP